jgi:succinoglycan biosynthesis protein ExoO
MRNTLSYPPSVTVLIAAYNAAEFLNVSVASALRQSVPPLEVLIVDDGSTDHTLEVAKRLQVNDVRIRILALPTNGGPSLARNAGIDAARGEWIAILDADDRFVDDHLENLLKAAGEDSDIVAANFHYYSPKEDALFPSGIPINDGHEHIDIYRFAEQARPYTDEADWGLLQPLLNRQFLNQSQLRYPSLSRHGEDYLFIMNAFLSHARFILSHKIGYLYTINSGSSRTQINYDTMWAHTLHLMQDPRVSGDLRLCKLLHQRVSAIKRMVAERRIDAFRQKHDTAALMITALTDVTLFREVVRKLSRKTKIMASRKSTSPLAGRLK